MAAKTVIELWLSGGPSSLETFDPKPNAPVDYNNGLKAIPTNVPGITIHEWWPELAKCADLYSIIRTMTHPHLGHETATYLMQTGRNPGGGEVYPAIGTVIAMMKGRDYKGDLPPSVILTTPKGRFSEVGFLGERYAPLVTGGNPTQPHFVVDGIVPPGGAGPEAIRRRFDLLADIDVFSVPKVFAEFDAAGTAARKIIEGDAAKTFDLSSEPDSVRDRYGRTWLGQSLLAARRLVEYGVPYITVNVSGWDTHKRHFETIRQRTAETDRAVSALLYDLKERGLLDTTLLWMCGEFGRTTRIDRDPPWNGGRNHYPRCFNALVAGGGFKGGCVVGKSDETATNVVERPVTPVDFLGSVYELCGIDPDGPMPNPLGKKLTVLPPQSKLGRLKELYRRFSLLAVCAGLTALSAFAADPYVGCLYPAGLQAGTTNRVLVWGQGLNGAANGLVSGEGVQMLSVEHVPNFPPPAGPQRKYLISWLERIHKGNTVPPPIPEKAKARTDEWRSNSWWTVLGELDAYRLAIVERDLYTKRNALQMTPSLRQQAIVTVAVDASAKPGPREFRLWGRNGISAPRPFFVSVSPRTMEPPFTPPFCERPTPPCVESLPAVLDGQIMPGETDRWQIRLRKDRPVVFRGVAREYQPYIGDAVPGFFNAVLRLCDATGREVAFSDDNIYHPDPYLAFTPSADGLYTLEIHDALYRGRADFVYSVFVHGGKTTERERLASLWPRPHTDIPRESLLASFEGVIDAPGAMKTHLFKVAEPGEYGVDLLARRAGSPLDGRVEVLDARGTVLASFSDVTNLVHCGSIIQGELDPVGKVQLKTPGTYSLRVGDEAGKGGAAWTYTARVHRHAPRFEVWLSKSAFVQPRGRDSKVKAFVVRHDGFADDVRLEDNEFVSFNPSVLPAGSNRVEVVVSARTQGPQLPRGIQIFAVGTGAEATNRVAVIPADEYNQAFAWDHLLPARGFLYKGFPQGQSGWGGKKRKNGKNGRNRKNKMKGKQK